MTLLTAAQEAGGLTVVGQTGRGGHASPPPRRRPLPPRTRHDRGAGHTVRCMPTDGLNAMPSTFPLLKWNKPKLHYGYQVEKNGVTDVKWASPSLNFLQEGTLHPSTQHACMHGTIHKGTPQIFRDF